jgi:hypothetical protein
MFGRSAKRASAFIALAVPITSGLAQAPPGEQPKSGEPKVISSVAQDFRFVTWEGGRGSNIFLPERGEGWQLYSPLTAGMIVEFAGTAKWELAAKTGYVWSHHGTKGQDATYEGMVDTQLSAKVTLGGFTHISPFVGVVVSVPTGESILPGQQRFTRMDPDLVEIGAYGAGANVNPIVGFTFAPTANFIIAPSIGYAWRGKFEREGGTLVLTGEVLPPGAPNDVVDPGDVLTASLNAAAKVGTWTVQGSFAYTSSTEVTRNGVPIGQKGAGYVTSLTALYPVGPKLNLTLVGAWAYYQKDRIAKDLQNPDGELFLEPKNGNGHLLIGAIQPTYDLTDRLRLGMTYSILHRTENSYDIVEQRFIAARTKHSLGLTLDYALSPTAIVTMTASRFWVHDEPGMLFVNSIPPENVPPEMDFTGWTASVAAAVKF